MQNLNDRLNRSLSPSNIRDLIRVTTNAGRPSNTVSIFKFSRDVEEGVARASALQKYPVAKTRLVITGTYREWPPQASSTTYCTAS